MNEQQRRAITKMYATLRRSMDPDPLLAELLSAELVTFDQFEDISSLSKAPEKNSRILQLIINHGSSEAFRVFCDCIEKADSAQKFLADELKGVLSWHVRIWGLHGNTRLTSGTSSCFSQLRA